MDQWETLGLCGNSIDEDSTVEVTDKNTQTLFKKRKNFEMN